VARTLTERLAEKRTSRMTAEALIAERAQTHRPGGEHLGARRRISGAKAAFALNRDERAVVRAWRKAQAQTGGALTPRVVQVALRKRVRRVREAEADFTPQRDTTGTLGMIRRSLNSLAGSFIEGHEDTDTLAEVLDVERAVEQLKEIALQTLQAGQYSDAHLGVVLGVTRQAAFQMRTRPKPR
jgi:hypothetical protein